MGKAADRQSQASPTIDAVEKESRRFFDSKLLERADEDPLTWWKDNEKDCREYSFYFLLSELQK